MTIRKKRFEETSELNIAFSQSGLGRFRVNVFMQRNEVAMVVRSLKTEIPTPEELGLPEILKELITRKSGLIIVTGPLESGKSTSLASLIKYRSQNTAGHIITIEDPIEFLHRHSPQSIINQREIGVDTLNYESALENALRQAPDLILIGESRTREAMNMRCVLLKLVIYVLQPCMRIMRIKLLIELLISFPMIAINKFFWIYRFILSLLFLSA